MYHELSLDLLDEADPRWLHRRRKTVLTVFRLAKDIHTLLMQKSEEFVSPCSKSKRRPVKVYRGGRRGRKHWTWQPLSIFERTCLPETVDRNASSD